MSAPWLTVVGIGADGMDGLGARARAAVAQAELLVGGRRHLAMVPEDDGCARLPWRSPLAETLEGLRAWRGRRVVVLATGDPLWYGIGRLLLRHVPRDELSILPHVSAFQEACARLGWALEEVHTVSLHGRPVESLYRHLQPGRRLLALTADGAAPGRIGAMLDDDGYGPTRIWVMEELGSAAERVVATTPGDVRGRRFADLNLMALELAADVTARLLPSTPGLPDDAFAHDGQLTKAELRALTLASLAPREGELLWDVGAGAGSVAIEWLRTGRAMRAVAVEQDPGRVARIGGNAARLGVPELEIVRGAAPACLADLPAPDAVFVGGGLATHGLLDACWRRLGPGGRFVANAVTLDGEAALLAFHARHGGRLLRVAISRAEPAGGQLVWRPAMPVTQLSTRKPCAAAS